MEKLFIYGATFAAGFLFFRFILSERQRHQEAASRLGLRTAPKIEGALIVNLLRPILGDIAKKLHLIQFPQYRKWIGHQLVVAGLKEKISVEEFWAFQIVSSILFPLIFGFLFKQIQLTPFFFILGLAYPVFWIRGVINFRKKEIRFALAPAVDLISISVEAGLDFIVAISRVVDRSLSGPMADELKQLVHEIKMGSTREQALRALALRVDDMSISSLTAVLIQADRLGTSIGPALKAQAIKMRTERFQAAEREGAAASQKILFPLVFFIIPAVFIVIFAPIVLQFLKGGFGGGF